MVSSVRKEVQTKIGVFHPGTQHFWQTALAFQESAHLAWYATSVFYDPHRWPYAIERWLPRKLSTRVHKEFTRRYHPGLDPRHVRQFGIWEWLESGARRLKRDALVGVLNEHGNIAFSRSVIRLIEREPVDVIWGANTSSLEVFRWAKKKGIRCVLDQTIGHPTAMNAIMLAEQDQNPEFFLQTYRPFDRRFIERQDEEAELADHIVVGSEFCARTMIDNGVSPTKIEIIPYGYDETLFPSTRPNRLPLSGRPIRFLFAGTIEPRKGVAYLLKAFQKIPQDRASLKLVGRLAIPEMTFNRYRERVQHVGQVPRSEMAGHFHEADCFVFPSLFEGGGIVLYEACGSGLGIVQTQACGDGVRSEQNGNNLNSLSVESLTGAVLGVLDKPERLLAWQDASWRLRPERDWGNYRNKLSKFLTNRK